MLSNIKKPISVLLVFAIAVIPLSCKSLDPKLLEQTASFDKGVTPMRVVINTDSINSTFHENIEFPSVPCCSFDERVQIYKILRQKLIFDRDTGSTYLSILIRKVELNWASAWSIASGMSLFLFNFFGMPIRRDMVTIDMEAAIMAPTNKIIKIYKTQGRDTEYVALYWGYSGGESYKLAYMRALQAGCADLRKQIEADRENINKLIR